SSVPRLWLGPLQLRHLDIRLPRRLGDAVARAAGERQVLRAAKVHAMSDAEEDRAGVVARAQDEADLLGLVHQRRRGAGGGRGIGEGADEDALGTADAGDVELDRQV